MVVTNIEHLSTMSVDNSKRGEQQTKANVQSRKVPRECLHEGHNKGTTIFRTDTGHFDVATVASAICYGL